MTNLPRLILLPLVLAASGFQVSIAQDFRVGSGISGAWYDPARDGEGWIVEVLPDDRAVVYWFTYPPVDRDGENAWILGTGTVEGDRIVVTESFINRGARFGAAFDPADLESESWGTWTMTFTGCDAGTLVFQGPPAFGSGAYELARLSRIQGSACGGGQHDPAATGFSGSWYEPASDGQGITLGVLPDGRVLLYWFTFDPDGNQQWLLGVGESHGSRLEFEEVFAFSGTNFGDSFDPQAIVASSWGSLSITFDKCGAGTLNYRGPDESWGAGSIPLTRLSRLAAHGCRLSDEAPLGKGSWGTPIPMNPGTSEVGATVLDGAAYVAGDLGSNRRAFLRLDPDAARFTPLRSLPNSRDHASLVALGGRIYVMGGRQSNKGIYSYDIERDRWQFVGGFPFPFGHAVGVALNGYIYAVGEGGDVRRFDPNQPGWEFLGQREGFNRDHAGLVAYRNELWWLGGRDSNYENTSSVDIFDPVTRVWRRGPSMPSSRSGFAAAVVQGQIMVAGGEDLGSAPILIPGLEVYSPRRGWRRGPDVPTPVHGVGGVELDGRFYLLGGSTNAGGAGSPGFSQVYIPGS